MQFQLLTDAFKNLDRLAHNWKHFNGRQQQA